MVVPVWSISEDLRQQKEKLINSSKTPRERCTQSLSVSPSSTWAFIYKHISTYICLCVYVCIYVYVCVCVCIYVYICM